MNRLVKAEFFRLKQRLFFLIAVSVLMALIPLAMNIREPERDLLAQLQGSGVMIMLVMMAFPPITAVVTASLYGQGKPGFYEFMAGNRTPAIVFSKIFSDGGLFLLLAVFSCCAHYIRVGLSHGTGGFDHALIRLLLVIVVLAHMVFCSVLLALLFRSPGWAGSMSYVRFFIFDSAGLPFLMWLATDVMGNPALGKHFAYMSVTNQIMILISEPLDATIVLHVLLGALIEFAFWYLLIDLGIRKRKIA